MKVTPLDIRRKEFKRSVRGYADEEVDLFLDEVADELDRLGQSNQELQEQVRRLDEQLVTHLQLRDALEKTLVSAQFQADEVRANARKESELILRDAELTARGIVSDSYSEVQRVQQALVQLKHLEEDFRFKFKSLLQGHLKLLAEAPINMPAGQPGVVDSAPEVEVPTPVAAPQVPVASVEPAAPAAPAAPVAAAPAAALNWVEPAAPPAAPASPAPAAETPFVVPTAFEDVPEYPRPVAPARPQRPAGPEPVVVPEGSAALEAPAVLFSQAVKAEPAVAATPPAEQTEPAPLLWSEPTVEETVDETATIEQATVGDESITMTREDDPLKGFLFGAHDSTAQGFFEGDKGGKNKARDFEW